MLELVFACFIGILIGTLTGMIPGIHVNTAGAILFASSAFLLGFLSPEFLCVLMVSMSIAHALTEFVPSMLLGVPQEGTATSILPGQRSYKNCCRWRIWGNCNYDFDDACFCSDIAFFT